MSHSNFAYISTPSTSIDLVYGRIKPEDIPVILQEPRTSIASRLISWTGLILVTLIIVAYYIVQKRKEQQELTSIKIEKLIDLRNSTIRKEKMFKNELDVPSAKYICIYIPLSSFDSVSPPQISCLFSFIATTTKHKVLNLYGEWSIVDDRYQIILELPNNCKLVSLIIRVEPNTLFAKNWNNSFKSIYIYVYDSTDRITWKDIILINLNTGDSKVGYISNGNIPIQFDLDKYT